jgi:hypothetical protein
MKKIFLSSAVLLASSIALANSAFADMAPMSHSGGMMPPPRMGSGMTQSGALEMQAVHMAMKQLTPADHAELMKIVRAYIESKGIKIPAPSDIKDMRMDNKEDRKDARHEMKEEKKETQQQIKETREAMKKKMEAQREALKKRIQERKQNVVQPK